MSARSGPPFDSTADFAAQREAMVREQIIARGVSDPATLAALRSIPRDRFVPPNQIEQAYADRALPIGPRQTISQPFIVAYMTEKLNVAPHHRVLEVGTGTGYQAAVLARLARDVHTVEHDASLARLAEQRLAALGLGQVQCHVGDGAVGLPTLAPFDRIIVTAACSEIPPALLQQLAEDGVLLAPVGAGSQQTLVRVVNRPGGRREQWLLACRFVRMQ
jgi:protein-L-isoaspartate(D-aspartate) O-methyltransferase